MNAEQLRQLQAPIKQRYRQAPQEALVTISATGQLIAGQVACRVNTHAGEVLAGLHPAAGGDGSQACSADMLLQALVACSGVTLSAVATALSIELRSAQVTADAEMDFRGTLGVQRSVPVGLTAIRLRFEIDSPAEDSQLSKLVELTERYCVIFQTLGSPAALSSGWVRPV